MKTILITGASSGLGEALALHYAREGQRLILGGRDPARLTAVAEACQSLGAEVHFQAGDVTVRDIMHRWVVDVDKRFPIDLVIANAGISGGTGGAVLSASLAASHQIFATNLNGVLNTIDPILPRMLERGCGQIALVSSLAGFAAWPGAPAYSASKAAVRVYGDALHVRLKPHGLKVTVICPGFVKTRMTDANPFPMPFLMSAEKAAAHIAHRLDVSNPPRIVFPWPTAFVSRALGLLPPTLSGWLLSRAPEKKALQSEEE
jgi:short-subunit dehydrogenase